MPSKSVFLKLKQIITLLATDNPYALLTLIRALRILPRMPDEHVHVATTKRLFSCTFGYN